MSFPQSITGDHDHTSHDHPTSVANDQDTDLQVPDSESGEHENGPVNHQHLPVEENLTLTRVPDCHGRII